MKKVCKEEFLIITVETKNLRKVIKEDILLNNINIKLNSGEVYGIVGNDNSGRIELLKILSGVIREYDGELKLFEKVLEKNSIYPDNIGTSFGAEGFIDEYTALKNLNILASIRGTIGEGEVKDALCIMGLLSVAREKVLDYTDEMRKKLTIAQAIMEKPRLIIIDEPFIHLGEDLVREVKTILKEIGKKRNTTIILGSKKEEDLKEICDEIYYIKLGKVDH